MTDKIVVTKYLDEMVEVLLAFGLSSKNLIFVDEFPEKYAKMLPGGISPFDPAMTFKPGKEIYFRKVIPHIYIEGSLSNLSVRGFSDSKVGALRRNDWLFVKHTLLHEICHVLDWYASDTKCDEWAFKELGT